MPWPIIIPGPIIWGAIMPGPIILGIPNIPGGRSILPLQIELAGATQTVEVSKRTPDVNLEIGYSFAQRIGIAIALVKHGL